MIYQDEFNEEDLQNIIKEALELNEESRILVINTDGLSNPEYYRSVVWDGKHTSSEDKE